MDERRVFDRLKADGKVNIRGEKDISCDFKAFLDNISFGGLGIYAIEKVNPGTMVSFELNTQTTDSPLIGKAMVRHVDNLTPNKSPLFSIGMEFVDTNKDYLTYLIKRLQAKQAEQSRSSKNIAPLDFMPY